MMQRGQVTIALAIVMLLLCSGVAPGPWQPKKNKLIDCRVRACEVNDFLIAFQKRGIPTTAMPAVAPAHDRCRAECLLRHQFGSGFSPILHRVEQTSRGPHAAAGFPSKSRVIRIAFNITRLNKLLSERRAISVKQYLEQQFSLPAEHLVAKGYGESQPRATNDTESGRRQNRTH